MYSVNTVHVQSVIEEVVKEKTTEQVYTQLELSERMYQQFVRSKCWQACVG